MWSLVLHDSLFQQNLMGQYQRTVSYGHWLPPEIVCGDGAVFPGHFPGCSTEEGLFLRVFNRQSILSKCLYIFPTAVFQDIYDISSLLTLDDH